MGEWGGRYSFFFFSGDSQECVAKEMGIALFPPLFPKSSPLFFPKWFRNPGFKVGSGIAICIGMDAKKREIRSTAMINEGEHYFFILLRT